MFSYGYDSRGLLTKVTPPGQGPEETYEHDYLGRQTLRRRGSGAQAIAWETSWENGESVMRRPLEVGAPSGATPETVSTLLDGRGRVARVRYQDSSLSAVNTDLSQVVYHRDGMDLPLHVAEERDSGNATVTYGYDTRSRLRTVTRTPTSQLNPAPVTVEYSLYTAWGAPSRVTSPEGQVEYSYLDSGRLHSVEGSFGTATFDWEPGGARLLGVSGGGLTERRCYDGRGRLTALVAALAVAGSGCYATDGLRVRQEYSYDGRGNVLAEIHEDAGGNDELTRYGYDLADRLTGVRYEGGSAELYSLDGRGVRVGYKELEAYSEFGSLEPQAFGWATSPSKHLSYGFDTRGHLQSLTDELSGAFAGEVTSDALGRVTRLAMGGVSRTLRWDATGALVQADVAPLSAAGVEGSPLRAFGFAYDHGGLRLEGGGPDGSARWLWGAGGELLEESLPGAGTRLNAWAGGKLVASDGARAGTDRLGSVVSREAAGGGDAALHRYDAWGSYREGTGWSKPEGGDPSVGYTGHQWDEGLGLVYAKARWYAPELGRFISEDPFPGLLSEPLSLEGFGYAHGNPLRYVDPEGMFRVPVVFGGGLFPTREQRYELREALPSVHHDLREGSASVGDYLVDAVGGAPGVLLATTTTNLLHVASLAAVSPYMLMLRPDDMVHGVATIPSRWRDDCLAAWAEGTLFSHEAAACLGVIGETAGLAAGVTAAGVRAAGLSSSQAAMGGQTSALTMGRAARPRAFIGPAGDPGGFTLVHGRLPTPSTVAAATVSAGLRPALPAGPTRMALPAGPAPRLMIGPAGDAGGFTLVHGRLPAATPTLALPAGPMRAALPAGPAPRALIAARRAEALIARASQVHGALHPVAQRMRTTAVLETSGGRVVAGGGVDLIPAQRALLGPGEVAARLPGAHAEVTALQHTVRAGLSPEAMAVTRAICPQCAAAIEASGGRLTSPTTVLWPK